jgi:hypothetical protein
LGSLLTIYLALHSILFHQLFQLQVQVIDSQFSIIVLGIQAVHKFIGVVVKLLSLSLQHIQSIFSLLIEIFIVSLIQRKIYFVLGLAQLILQSNVNIFI